MAYRDVRLGQLLRVYIDGVPLDLASTLLPYRSRLVFPLFLHIHMHAASQRRYANKPIKKSAQVSRESLFGLIDSLKSAVNKLRWLPKGTAWGDYYDQTNYTQAGLTQKEEIVNAYLETIQPGNVWDLGANTGRFSRLASSRGIPTISFDIDPGAVEQNYLETVSKREANLLPLVLDLTNPSPGIGWQNKERMGLLERGPAGAVLALALIHHLAISNNVPLHRLAEFFWQLSRWLVIEFVPKSDSQVQRLLATREDIFPDYTQEGFERIFSNYFSFHRIQPIRDSQRFIYLMEKR
jgi:ribosomal protein L11 methylase PrmA